MDDVPEGSALAVTSGGGPLLLVRTSGDAVSAYSAVCPHQGCTVAPLGDRLVCPCHGSSFDPASGAVLQGPATSDLTAVPVAVVDGEVVLA